MQWQCEPQRPAAKACALHRLLRDRGSGSRLSPPRDRGAGL